MTVALSFFCRNDLVDQTDLRSAISLDVTCGVDHFLSDSGADQAGQTLCTAESRRDAQTDFRLTEYGVFRSDADVAAHGQLASSAQRKAVDGSDDRASERFDLAEYRISELSIFSGFFHALILHLGDVCASDERLLSCAGDDQRIDILICSHFIQCGIQVSQYGRAQGVERLGAVDGNGGNMAFLSD